jgi:hemoglobin-like flavoprotein
MTRVTAALVRTSFLGISDRVDHLVEGFYNRLFSAHPEVRRIFPQDMARQREHLAAALAVVFRNAETLDALEGSLMALGAQHAEFGAAPVHYVWVRDALLDSLAEAHGAGWTEQVSGAWRLALNEICAAMLRGAAAASLSIAHELSPGTD